MQKIITILFLFLIGINIFAAEQSLNQELAKIWQNEKITPEQPFTAKIIAAGGMSPWSGVTHIYLQEIGGKQRFCLATIYYGVRSDKKVIDYEILKEKPDFTMKNSPFSSGHHYSGSYNACLFTPAVPIDKFVWIECLQGCGVGKKFGDKDLIHKQITEHHNHRKMENKSQ